MNRAISPAKSRTDAGRFVKGRSGNPRGRLLGTKTKRTLEWEEFGRSLVDGNLRWLQSRMDYLKDSDPDAAVELFMRVLEYFKPKLSRQELKAPRGSEVTYTLKFK